MSNKQSDQFLNFISEAINEKFDRIEHLIERSKEHPRAHEDLKKEVKNRLEEIKKEL